MTQHATTSAKEIIYNVYNNTFSMVKSKSDFYLIEKGTKELIGLCDQKVITQVDIIEYIKENDPTFLEESLQGHCIRKPYGYAGDFEIIEKLYAQTVSEKPEYRIWDEYAQNTHSSKAVRNRKSYFVDLIDSLLSLIHI